MSDMDTPPIRGDRFLVIGRAGMDLYADPPGTPIAEASRFTAALGGSSGNIAAALARQGARVAFLGCISDDGVGRFTQTQLASYGIDTALLRTVPGPARNTLAVVDTMGTETEAVIYRHEAADLTFGPDDAARPDYHAYDALILTGTMLTAEPSRAGAFAAIERARNAGMAVVLDLDYRAQTWSSHAEAAEIYGRAADASTILVGNEEEFAVFTHGRTHGRAEDGPDAARELAADGRIVVYKRGGDGAVTLSGLGNGVEEIRTGIFKTDALKPTGAGDAFLGGFLSALAAGTSLERAILRGSAAAAIVVSRVGCAPATPTKAELDAFLTANPTPTDPL